MVIIKNSKKIYDYKYNIGDIIPFFSKKQHYIQIVDKIIISRISNGKSRNEKGYLCKCLTCNGEYQKTEHQLVSGYGCKYCSHKCVKVGYNDIATTHPHLVSHMLNKEDSYLYTFQSSKKIWFICERCGNNKYMAIRDFVNQGIACRSCSDGISYPEKIFYNLLKQLDIDYIHEVNKKQLNWCKSYRYDFYIPSLNCIIEIHGEQHYNNGFKTMNKKNVNQLDVDILKKELALANGVDKYIEIDCSLSELDYIKNSIMSNDKLVECLGLDKYTIDWEEINRKSLESFVVLACKLWEEHRDLSYIEKELNKSRSTVTRYLKKGSISNLCTYNPIQNKKEKLSKKVMVLKDDVCVFEYDSVQDLSKNSLIDLGIQINDHVVYACIKQNSIHKKSGFLFKYKTKDEEYESC